MIEVSPLFNFILVRRISEKETTDGGIIIPDNTREKPTEGFVIAVGPGRVTDLGVAIPMLVHVGDRVMFPRYAGTEMEIEEQPFLLVREEELQAIVRHVPAKLEQEVWDARLDENLGSTVMFTDGPIGQGQ